MWTWLTDYSRFPPRRHCGDWHNWEVHMHLWSEWTIAFCYFAIPVLVVLLYWSGNLVGYFGHTVRIHRGQGPTLGTRALAAFVLLCGVTHALEAMIFDIPMYPVLGVALFVTALVSVWNVWLLVHWGALAGLAVRKQVR